MILLEAEKSITQKKNIITQVIEISLELDESRQILESDMCCHGNYPTSAFVVCISDFISCQGAFSFFQNNKVRVCMNIIIPVSKDT